MTTPPLSTAWVPLWPLTPAVPAVQNGKWIKGVGGALVWSDVVGLTAPSVSVANVDLPVPTSDVHGIQIFAGGGSVRSIGSWVGPGSARVLISNWIGSSAITLIAGATGLPAGQTALGIMGGANLVLAPGESVEFYWDGSWREVNRNVISSGGYREVDYAQITANMTCSATTSASATLIVNGATVTYAAVPTLVEFFTPGMGAGNTTWGLVLYDGNTQLGLLGQKTDAIGVNIPVHVSTRFTPAAGAHQYNIRGWVGVGGAGVQAGTGAAGAVVPAYMRVQQKMP